MPTTKLIHDRLPSELLEAPHEPPSSASTEVTRHVREPVQRLLWGRAAGRCEFRECNRPLWKSLASQNQVNVAEKAHIHSIGTNGPRGRGGLTGEELNKIANLLLVCHQCHRDIDQKRDGGQFTPEVLRAMKAAHEERIERVTGINPRRSSHVLKYSVNVGSFSAPLDTTLAAEALFAANRFPAGDRPIELGAVDSSGRDHDTEFWAAEEKALLSKFETRVAQRLADGSIHHLSVFALGPQPLLVRLGCLLTDIPRTDVYQLHREPPRWAWPSRDRDIEFEVTRPADFMGDPALVISLSASIAPERVRAIIGSQSSIWVIRVQEPSNDFVVSPKILSSFRRAMRLLLNDIKLRHGHDSTLHIFPAMPVATAVELGRVRQPKADMPWVIYDENRKIGGFQRAIRIGHGVNHE